MLRIVNNVMIHRISVFFLGYVSVTIFYFEVFSEYDVLYSDLAVFLSSALLSLILYQDEAINKCEAYNPFHVMLVPVTTAWCVLRLQLEEMASRYEGQL
jgi:hypothetical protein